MKKSALIFMVVLCIANTSFGQTAVSLEKKYGSEKYYKVRNHSLLSPKFDKRGQICRAIIEPNHFARSPEGLFDLVLPVYHFADKAQMFPIYLLDRQELKEIFDELAPIATRKGNGKAHFDGSGFGVNYRYTYRFDNIAIFTRLVIFKENSVINYSVFGNDLDGFFDPPVGSISKAEIVWTDRTCVDD